MTPEGFQPCSVFSTQMVCLAWQNDQYDYPGLVRAVTAIVGKRPDDEATGMKSAVWYLDRARIEVTQLVFVILRVDALIKS